jgi:tetratricopeptide (TPR) repeat protein
MITESKKKLLEVFSEGRKNYKLMRFREALECFAKALKADPDDGPSKVYYARCKHYLENPPAEDWDGVFVMKTK